MRQIFTEKSMWKNDRKAINKLTHKQQILFAADIARSVYHIWEEHDSKDLRVITAIEIAEKVAFDYAADNVVATADAALAAAREAAAAAQAAAAAASVAGYA